LNAARGRGTIRVLATKGSRLQVVSDARAIVPGRKVPGHREREEAKTSHRASIVAVISAGLLAVPTSAVGRDLVAGGQHAIRRTGTALVDVATYEGS